MLTRASIRDYIQEKIKQADIMVIHHETLGQDDLANLKRDESQMWDYIDGLIEDDIENNPQEDFEDFSPADVPVPIQERFTFIDEHPIDGEYKP